MINIKRTEKTVKIQATTGLGWDVHFTIDRSTELDAILLHNHLQHKLNDRIATIRKEAYELGWRDAKAKKRSKLTWFNGSINDDTTGF